MKKIHSLVAATALLAVAFVVPNLSAHERGHRGGHHGMRAEKMADLLELTDAQKTQLKQMRRAHRDAMEALHDNDSLTREQRREQAMVLRKNFAEQRRALLTPAQQEKADALREKMHERRKSRGGHGRGHGDRDGHSSGH